MGGIHDDNDKDRKDDDREVVLDPRIQEAIGKSLKAHYDDLIKAPMPDRLSNSPRNTARQRCMSSRTRGSARSCSQDAGP